MKLQVDPDKDLWVAPGSGDAEFILKSYIEFLTISHPELLDNYARIIIAEAEEDLEKGDLSNISYLAFECWPNFMQRFAPETHFFGQLSGGGSDYRYWPKSWDSEYREESNG